MRGSRIPAVAVALTVVGLVGIASLLLLSGRATTDRDGLGGTGGGMGVFGGGRGGMLGVNGMDARFIEQMIPHHQMAVMMTRMAGRAGGREELRVLTDSMRREQTREIRMMEGWYRDWYGG